MKICLVAAFPPSGRALAEYTYHVAREIQRHGEVELTILADEIGDEKSPSSVAGEDVRPRASGELPGFHVIRCWRFGSASTPIRLLKEIRACKPDIVWFNLVYSSFASPANPFAAFAGLSAPALCRAMGFYTHITLHHISEHMDMESAGMRRSKLYTLGTNLITRTLLRAHSVSVLLSAYRRTLTTKYAAENIVLGTHGVFSALPMPPDFTKRGNPEHRILAFGHWGTYKRLEVLLAAFPKILERVPTARLIIGGGNHPTKPGYWESVRDSVPEGLPVKFLGYVPQQDVTELFRTSSLLVMPYDSSTGSSGPAHQACEHGVPIVCADIEDFRCMGDDEDMAISFFQVGNPDDLVEKVVHILESPQLEHQMARHNYQAGVQMTMANIARTYLRWFLLQRCKHHVSTKLPNGKRKLTGWAKRIAKQTPADWTVEADLMPDEPTELRRVPEAHRIDPKHS